uniref:Uncharacterized protein n=1 Tax=viral metagenome TaxID=1070528 RepID=A0A6C0II13_9ZZZZ
MTEITVTAKTVTADGDEDIFGPYNTIQDIVLVQYILHKHLGNHISVSYGDGEYLLKYVDNNDDFEAKLHSIFEPFDELPYKYNYAYAFLKNHHLIFSVKHF